MDSSLPVPASPPQSEHLQAQSIGLTTMINTTEEQQANDAAEIRGLIGQWAKAIRDENRASIRENHDPDILMFDVPPPFLSRGLDAYMATWETFFTSQAKPVTFDLDDLRVTCGRDVAFATAIGTCIDPDRDSIQQPLKFRLTMGLRKVDGKWCIMHEHHSLPAT
jgi:uncharacterized protein (TIGR02246 family)